jgi:predicted O-methyltransferase YrrM
VEIRRFSKPYIVAKTAEFVLNRMVQPLPEIDAIAGYLHPAEARLLFWLAQQLPPGGLAVEIGSFKGKSACCLAAGLGKGGILACVDTWHNDAMPYDSPRDCLPEFLANTLPFRDRIEVHRGRSQDVAKNWSQPVDLVFIDGDHSYEGCVTDLRSWLGFVRPGGWVAFHDSGQAGVKRAIEELFPPRLRYRELWVRSLFAARKRD